MTTTALILHGGGGPATVTPIAEHLSTSMRTIVPTHPGWNGTSRPENIRTISDVAGGYLDLLDEQDLTGVVVIGSSIGGWIAADMATRDARGRLSAAVLIDAGGIAVPEQPMADFFSLDPRGIAEHSYHDPDRFYIDPATMPADRLQLMRGNIETLRAIAGDPYMHDPALKQRLGAVRIPVLVLWGESDRVFTPDYGRAYAKAFGGAEFRLIERAGHLPQLEQPAATFTALDTFLKGHMLG